MPSPRGAVAPRGQYNITLINQVPGDNNRQDKVVPTPRMCLFVVVSAGTCVPTKVLTPSIQHLAPASFITHCICRGKLFTDTKSKAPASKRPTVSPVLCCPCQFQFRFPVKSFLATHYIISASRPMQEECACMQRIFHLCMSSFLQPVSLLASPPLITASIRINPMPGCRQCRHTYIQTDRQ